MGLLQDLCEPLKADQIDWMPKRLMSYGDSVYAQIIAYKDARVDRQRLDDVFGVQWCNKYQRDEKGILQCGIGCFVKLEDGNYHWVWRWSNGTPSEFEKEKGEYSDAFKRAGFMWGIGIELYDMPNLRVTLNEKEFTIKDNKPKASYSLKPNDWTWEIQRNEDDGHIHRVTAHQYINGKNVLRCDSNPYDSKNPRS